MADLIEVCDLVSETDSDFFKEEGTDHVLDLKRMTTEEFMKRETA
jgi:hypothetical protein